MTFDSFNLHPRIMAGVQALGYKTPSPIQQQAIPLVLEGRDVMGLAQTGTGKTAAFVLPILQRLMTGQRGRVRALIITPTRELAQQIHDAIEGFSKGCDLRSVALYGGMSINSQIHRLRRGVEIVVACPGRLLDHVKQRTINLSHLEVLVLDEADQMFDMGFLPNVRKILQIIPKDRQSLLFSATMPSDVRQLAEDVLTDPIRIQIGHNAPTKTVVQALYPVPPNLKTDLLVKIIQTTEMPSVLVFTRTKHRAQKLAEQLNHLGYKVSSLQGNLSQAKRQAALNDFRKGKLQILVATDIASRGIDVAGISHVINYDMPNTVEAYTHRIGRTGRASKLGDAFTLVTREDLPRVRAIERLLGTKLEQRHIDDFDYKAKTAVDAAPSDHEYSERPSARRSHSKEGSSGRGEQRSYKPRSHSESSHKGEKRRYSAHESSRPHARSEETKGEDRFPKRKFSEAKPRFNEGRSERKDERPRSNEHRSDSNRTRDKSTGFAERDRPFNRNKAAGSTGPFRGDRSESRSERPRSSEHRSDSYRPRDKSAGFAERDRPFNRSERPRSSEHRSDSYRPRDKSAGFAERDRPFNRGKAAGSTEHFRNERSNSRDERPRSSEQRSSSYRSRDGFSPAKERSFSRGRPEGSASHFRDAKSNDRGRSSERATPAKSREKLSLDPTRKRPQRDSSSEQRSFSKPRSNSGSKFSSPRDGKNAGFKRRPRSK